MFTRRQKILKNISGLLIGLILLVAVFIFVCPMSNMPTTMSMDAPTLCADHTSGSILPADTGMSPHCFGFHLSIIEQFTKALFEKLNAFFLALGIFSVYSLIVRKISFEFLKSKLTRFRQRFFQYFQIRHRFRKKFLEWLLFVNSYSI